MTKEFKVQWYDFGIKGWKKFGPIETDARIAEEKAYILYDTKRRMIHVRVRAEETVIEWTKN